MINPKSEILNPKLISAVLISLLLLNISCSKPKQVEYEYNDFIFGSYLRIKISAQDSVQAKQAIGKIMQEFYHIDSIASCFNPHSEVCKINKIGFGKMSEDLKALVDKSLEVSDKTNGAFDITIGPAMKTFGFYDKNQMNLFTTNNTNNTNDTNLIKELDKDIRAISEIREISCNIFYDSIIGYKKIRIKGDTIFLKPKMAIDLGGLTVGYALDKAVDICKNSRIQTGLIDAGGDIVCFGNRVYNIGIKNPKGEGIIKTMPIKNQSISTSGNYEKFIEKDNMKYTHIINPKTGQAIAETKQGLCSVTIIADKCVDADAYATAVFVLGADSGQNLIRKLKLKGILVTNDGKLLEIQ